MAGILHVVLPRSGVVQSELSTCQLLKVELCSGAHWNNSTRRVCARLEAAVVRGSGAIGSRPVVLKLSHVKLVYAFASPSS